MVTITYDLTIQNVAALLYGYHGTKTPDQEDPMFNNKKSAKYSCFSFKNLTDHDFYETHFGNACLETIILRKKKIRKWEELTTYARKELFSVPYYVHDDDEDRYSTSLRNQLATKLASATDHIDRIYKNIQPILKNFNITAREVNRLYNFTQKASCADAFYCSDDYRSSFFSAVLSLLNANSETYLDDFAKALTMLLIGALLSDQTEMIRYWFKNVQVIPGGTDFEESSEMITMPFVQPGTSTSKHAVKKTDLTKIQYEQSYTSAMFLNTRETGRPSISLKDLYQVPVFESDDPLIEAETFPDYFKMLLEETAQNASPKLLTIVGQPGSGKSSLIKYLLNNADLLSCLEMNGYDEIIIQRFAELPKELDWSSCNANTASQLFAACGIDLKDAASINNKLLILDGFDEIEVAGNTEGRRYMIEFLSKFIRLEKNIKNLFMVITCREQYIDYEYLDTYAVLSPLTSEQICEFIEKYNNQMLHSDAPDPEQYIYKLPPLEQILREEASAKKKEEAVQSYETVSKSSQMHNNLTDILSIPLILYMTTALKIEFTGGNKTQTITDVYDRIFRLKGGIFDHYDFAYDDEQISYNQENSSLLQDYRDELLVISKSIARQMFLLQPSKAEISDVAYLNIIDHAVNKISSQYPNSSTSREELSLYMKGNNFLRYLEGAQSHYFVHRSMYEYFFASWIFDQMKCILIPSANISQENQKEKMQARTELLQVLSARQLSADIKKHLAGKIAGACRNENRKKNSLKELWKKEWMQDFIDCLSTEFYHPDVCTEKIFELHKKDTTAFLNSLGILQVLCEACRTNPKERITFTDPSTKKRFYQYIRTALFYKTEAEKNFIANSSTEGLPASVEASFITEVDLQYLNLDDIDLSNLNLTGTALSHCSIRNAAFLQSNLQNVSITDSDFTGSNFFSSNMALLTAEACRFTSCRMRKVSLESAELKKCIFDQGYMEDCNLHAANLQKSHFIETDLSGASLEYVQAKDCNFSNAVLYNVNLEAADLSGANFEEAKMNGSSIKNCITSSATKGL